MAERILQDRETKVLGEVRDSVASGTLISMEDLIGDPSIFYLHFAAGKQSRIGDISTSEPSFTA